jgi:hypothetical protein
MKELYELVKETPELKAERVRLAEQQKDKFVKKPYAMTAMAFLSLCQQQVIKKQREDGSYAPDLLACILWSSHSANDTLAYLANTSPKLYQSQWKSLIKKFFSSIQLSPDHKLNPRDRKTLTLLSLHNEGHEGTKDEDEQEQRYDVAFRQYYNWAMERASIFSEPSVPLYTDRAFLVKYLQFHPRALFDKEILREFREDQDLLLMVIEAIRSQYHLHEFFSRISKRLKANPEFIARCFEIHKELIRFASDDLQFDYSSKILNLMAERYDLRPNYRSLPELKVFFSQLSLRLKGNLAFMEASVKLCGELIHFASDELKFSNKALVVNATINTRHSIFLSSLHYQPDERLRKSPEEMLKKWRVDNDIMTLAIMWNNSKPNVHKLSVPLRQNPNILLSYPIENRDDTLSACADRRLQKDPVFVRAMGNVPVFFYLKMGATLAGSLGFITVGILAIVSIITLPVAAAVGIGAGVASVLVGSSGLGFFGYKMYKLDADAEVMRIAASRAKEQVSARVDSWNIYPSDAEFYSDVSITRLGN